MAPIGFVSDHMEVLYDLDTEATAKAAELGLPVAPLGDRGRRPAVRRRGPRAGPGARRHRAAGSQVTPVRAGRARPEPRPVPGRLLPGPRPQARRRGRRQPVRVRSTVTDQSEHLTDLKAELLELALEAARRAGSPAARRPPGRPRRGRDQVQPDRRRHRDGHRRREADHRLPRRAPPRRRLPRRGGRQPRRARSGVRWVIDPLDGTVNYLYGLPTWAVSIAAERDGETRRRRRRRPRCAARPTTRCCGGGAYAERRAPRALPARARRWTRPWSRTGFNYVAERPRPTRPRSPSG